MSKAIATYLARLREAFPAFKNFGDGSDEFDKAERLYKIELVELYQGTVAQELEDWPESSEAQISLGKKISALFTTRLKHAENKPQNLVGFRYFGPVQFQGDENAGWAQLVRGLIHGKANLGERIDSFVAGLQPLVSKNVHNNKVAFNALSRSITSFLLMLSDKERHGIIKTQEFNRALKAFEQPPMSNAPLSGQEYLRIQKFLDDVRTELIALKLTPRDMIDVQSFVWVGDEKTYQSAEQYWLLGAYWDDVGDMTAKFVGEDRWENGYKDKFLEKVRTVKKGDRVAIKSSYTRKHDLPFNNHGKMISCMDIKARGIVKENKGDGRHLVVEWEKDFDVRTIYFYTYRSTIDLIDKTKYKQTTIPWVFGDEEQDKDWLEEQSVQITPEVLSESSASTIELNRIFYGPPGTGKTHRTIDEALQILDRAYYEENRGNRTKLKLKFDELLGADHIHFVTFHQSFSYEDFVEGIRAVTDESGAIRYIVEDGVFKKICDSASYAVRAGDPIGKSYKVRKVSPDVLVIVKEGGSEVPFTWEFLRELIRLVQSGKIALGDIKKGEVFAKVPDSLLEKHLVNGYSNLLAPLVERLMRSPNRANHGDENPAPPGSPKVLIIDEINRGNPSRIFGELITLIEVSKRKGNDESLEVTLPYSKKRFSIPNNVYLIGTMNTADRSLMGLDIALRRRFSFVEMSPQPDLLNNVEIEGIKVGDVLRAMNERIEVLLDRDHCLGHTYFLPLIASPDLVSLAAIFSNQIMPLLKEYFFEDWERIRWVLNDHRKQNQKDCFVVEPERKSSVLFGAELAEKLQDNRWEINDEAFSVASSYKGILEMPA